HRQSSRPWPLPQEIQIPTGNPDPPGNRNTHRESESPQELPTGAPRKSSHKSSHESPGGTGAGGAPILDRTPQPGPVLPLTATRADTAENALRRELYLFALYRTLEAAVLALVVFSPFGGLIGEPRDPFLASAVAVAYLPMALALLLATRRDRSALGWQACLGVGVDIAVAALITHAIPGAAPGVAMMLLFNV